MERPKYKNLYVWMSTEGINFVYGLTRIQKGMRYQYEGNIYEVTSIKSVEIKQHSDGHNAVFIQFRGKLLGKALQKVKIREDIDSLSAGKMGYIVKKWEWPDGKTGCYVVFDGLPDNYLFDVSETIPL